MIYFDGKQVEFASFPNGEVRLPLHGGGYRDNMVRFQWDGDESLMELGMWKSMMDQRAPGNHLRLIIEYMPYSRMDRQTSDFFSLKYVANFINQMGWYEVVVVEPHSDVTCALLDNARQWLVVPEVLVSRPINFDPLLPFDPEEDFIFFPDAGAAKRYSSYFGGYKVLVGSKRRTESGVIDHYEINGLGLGVSLKNHRVIIVDDLCSYGGTFMHAAHAMPEAAQIDLVVAHLESSVFEGSILTEYDALRRSHTIENIYATSSIITPEQASKCSRIHLYDMKTGEWT